MMVKRTFNSALLGFAVFPTYERSIEYLANNLADPEDWEFSDVRNKKMKKRLPNVV